MPWWKKLAKENIENKVMPESEALHNSNMSSVDSITYANSVDDLKDLDMDKIKLFEHYKFKDPSRKSNGLEIADSKDKVNSYEFLRLIITVL